MAEPCEPYDARREEIAAARAGDEAAFTALYQRHQPAVLRYLGVRMPWAAEDLASQVWLEAARGLSGFDGDDTGFRCWLFVIARRRLANERRRLGRAGIVAAEQDLAAAPAPDDPAEDTLERLAGDQAARLLARLLPERQAEVVLMRVVAGLSVEDTARLVGQRPGTVRVLQHRALRTLAKKLDGRVTEDGLAGMWSM